MNPKNKLAEMPVRPLLYTMAVPLMLSLLIQSLYNIVDSIFVARLSETALTAASLVYAIQFLMIAIGVGTAVGLNALLSRKLGQKKPEEACRAATTGLFLMLGTSLVFTLVGLLFSNRIAAALTNGKPLPPAPKCRLSRRSRHFPTRPSVQIQPDESGRAFILNIVATDRLGLLYAISKVLAKYDVNLQTAKLATLGERAEDVFLIDGEALHDDATLLQLEAELIEALLPKSN